MMKNEDSVGQPPGDAAMVENDVDAASISDNEHIDLFGEPDQEDQLQTNEGQEEIADAQNTSDTDKNDETNVNLDTTPENNMNTVGNTQVNEVSEPNEPALEQEEKKLPTDNANVLDSSNSLLGESEQTSELSNKSPTELEQTSQEPDIVEGSVIDSDKEQPSKQITEQSSEDNNKQIEAQEIEKNEMLDSNLTTEATEENEEQSLDQVQSSNVETTAEQDDEEKSAPLELNTTEDHNDSVQNSLEEESEQLSEAVIDPEIIPKSETENAVDDTEKSVEEKTIDDDKTPNEIDTPIENKDVEMEDRLGSNAIESSEDVIKSKQNVEDEKMEEFGVTNDENETNENSVTTNEQDQKDVNMGYDSVENGVTQTEETTNDLIIPQSHEIVIPSYANWFNLNKVHQIEKKSLPEFFTNRIPSKTPQVYMKYRNFMVNTYRINPNEYFTATAARRNISGDAATLLRLHKFLNKWGLINYQVDAKILPKNIEPPLTSKYSVRHDAPRGLFPFESYKPATQLPDLSKLKRVIDSIDDDGKGKRKFVKDDDDIKEEVVSSDSDETNKTKKPKILEESQKMNENSKHNWDEESIKKLLSGIQQFNTDWFKVAKHVGDKTPEQCILKFLQLPIEDKFLLNSKDLGPLKFAPHLPFSKSDNPILSTIAFLVGLVDPQVVKKMTVKAIDSYEQLNKKEEQESSEENSSEKNDLVEGTNIAMASIGTRSHIFKNNEERKLNSIANQLVTLQLKKVDQKLKLLDVVEKSLEVEKKSIQKQQEDILLRKLVMTKHSNKIYNKLNELVESFELGEDSANLRTQLTDVKELLAHPPTLNIGSNSNKNNSHTDNGSSTATNADKNGTQPVSIEAPQLYRYWSA